MHPSSNGIGNNEKNKNNANNIFVVEPFDNTTNSTQQKSGESSVPDQPVIMCNLQPNSQILSDYGLSFFNQLGSVSEIIQDNLSMYPDNNSAHQASIPHGYNPYYLSQNNINFQNPSVAPPTLQRLHPSLNNYQFNDNQNMLMGQNFIITVPQQAEAYNNLNSYITIPSNTSNNGGINTYYNGNQWVNPLNGIPNIEATPLFYPHSQRQERGQLPTINGDSEYLKPVFSYSCLIALALKNSDKGSLPVNEIYKYMQDNFPYFKTARDGWKNSVRHNLSLNKAFQKTMRTDTSISQRKGCLWTLKPEKKKAIEREIKKWFTKHPDSIRRSLQNPDIFESYFNQMVVESEDDDSRSDNRDELYHESILNNGNDMMPNNHETSQSLDNCSLFSRDVCLPPSYNGLSNENQRNVKTVLDRFGEENLVTWNSMIDSNTKYPFDFLNHFQNGNIDGNTFFYQDICSSPPTSTNSTNKNSPISHNDTQKSPKRKFP